MDTQTGVRAAPNVGDAEPPFDEVLSAHEAVTAARVALGDRVRLCRGAMTRKEFAARLFVHLNTVGKMERGEAVPDAFMCAQISEIGKRSVEWLVTGNEAAGSKWTVPAHSLTAVESGPYVFVPHFDVSASAGHGDLFNNLESVIAMRPFDRDFIRVELGIPHDEIALHWVIGNSMEALLHSKDTVLVDRRASLEMISDGIHTIVVDGGLLIKQVQRLPGRVYRISSLNPAYPPFEIRAADEEAQREFAIAGKVRWAGVTIK